MNIELNEKIILALKSPFIGEMEFSEDEIDDMVDDCCKAYKNCKNRYGKALTSSEVDELVVLIINIAKTWIDESEGRFWVKLYNEIFEDGSIQPSKFYDDYENCLNRYGHKLYRSKENKRMFRETFLMHAFSPETSSDSFIKLLWKWYSDNEILNFDYRNDEDKQIILKFVQFLRSTFSAEDDFDDDVSFEGNVYQIRSSFKYLFTQDSDKGYVLLDSLFSSFNSVYRSFEKKDGSFLWKRSSIVINKMLEEARVSRGGRRIKTTNHIIDDYSKIYVDYNFNSSNELVLALPEIRAIDEIADDYYIDLFINNEKVERYDGYVLGEGFRRKIKSREIPLINYQDKLGEYFDVRVEMYLVRKGVAIQIYNSKQTLRRNYILFKSSREIRSEVCNPGTYYIAFPNSLDFKYYTNCAASYVNPLVNALVAEEGSYITLNDRRTFFSVKQKGFSQFIPEGTEVKDLYFIKDGMELPVYRYVDGISILSSDIINNPASVVMNINDDLKVPLSEVVLKKDAILYVDLVSNKSIKHGYNKISFVDMTKQKMLNSFEFCVNGKLSYAKMDYSFDKHSSKVAINNGIEEYDTVIMSPDKDSYQFEYKEEQYVLHIPRIGWRVDKNEWNYNRINDVIWHEDEMLHNNCLIEIENMSDQSVKVLANDHILEKSDEYSYKLGDMLTELEKDELITVTMIIGKDKYDILKIANEEILEDFDIDIENKNVTILPYYTGGESSEFVIELEGDENTYTIELKDDFTFDENVEDNYYTVTILLKDFFGENKVLLDGDYAIGNLDKIAFVNRNIELKQFRNPDGGKIKLSNTYITNIKYLRNEGYTSIYSGTFSIAKKNIEVEIHVRDEKVLSFFQISNDNLIPMNYDSTKKMFTLSKPDGNNIIPCGTCYYSKKEI